MKVYEVFEADDADQVIRNVGGRLELPDEIGHSRPYGRVPVHTLGHAGAVRRRLGRFSGMFDVPQGARRQESIGVSLPRWIVASAVAIAASAMLSACVDQTPEPSISLVTTPPPSATSESKTASSAPPAPEETRGRSEHVVEPEAMQSIDEVGAIAAARYFMGLFEYVHLTGDLSKWEEMATPSCDFCVAVTEGVKELHGKGQFRESGPPEWLGEAITKKVGTRTMWEVHMRAQVSGSVTYDKNGEVVDTNEPERVAVSLGMQHDGTGWRTVEVLVESDD